MDEQSWESLIRRHFKIESYFYAIYRLICIFVVKINLFVFLGFNSSVPIENGCSFSSFSSFFRSEDFPSLFLETVNWIHNSFFHCSKWYFLTTTRGVIAHIIAWCLCQLERLIIWEMENSYKDGLPILLSGARSQLPDESMEVELVKRLDARSTTRSSSMSLPYYSSEVSYESESRPVYHTGPLLGRGTPPISKKNAENSFLPSLQKMGGNPAAVAATEFSSVHVSTDQGCEGENYTARNEHLLRSGPLGRCNDPYCTTCPYYPQPSPRKKSYTVSSFDTTVFFFSSD